MVYTLALGIAGSVGSKLILGAIFPISTPHPQKNKKTGCGALDPVRATHHGWLLRLIYAYI